MPAELRHIAIHVEEPQAGDFRWVLTERADGEPWEVRHTSDAAARTYKQAMADGLVALERMVEDLDAGPRRPAQTVFISNLVATTKNRSTAAAQDEADAPSFFGFGPVR